MKLADVKYDILSSNYSHAEWLIFWEGDGLSKKSIKVLCDYYMKHKFWKMILKILIWYN